MSYRFNPSIAALSLVFVSALSVAQPAGVGPILVNAHEISVSGSGHHKSFPCNGRKVFIEGSDHVVTFTGTCSQVVISGANNKVNVTVASNGSLTVEGSDHNVRWKSTGEPNQDVSGIDNKVNRVK